MSLNTYIVTSPVKYNGERFAPGDRIELCEEAAARLRASGAVADRPIEAPGSGAPRAPAPDQNNPNRKPAPEDPAARIAAIREVISQLDQNNPAHWTGGGVPQVAALTEQLGWPVTAVERNDAWMAVQSDKDIK
jgi:hypothetical protein